MEISEEHLAKLEKEHEEELKAQKRYYESELTLLKAKVEYERNKKEADFDNILQRAKDEVKAVYDVKSTENNEIQKQYYEKELESQKQWYEEELNRKQNETVQWYEEEIIRRQNETAQWHENKNQEIISELKKGYEEMLAAKDDKIKALEDEINAKEDIYKAKEEALSIHITELNKYYENELRPFNKLRKIRNKVKKIVNKLSLKDKKETIVPVMKPTCENSEYGETGIPKVSVILPVYNVGKYLRQSLDSLINQTLKEIEIICVDDGSTDDCYEILEEYKAKDGRIKVIHKENKGTGAARNDGLRLATGECIGFVDPDDWVKPEMFERLYNLIKEKDLDIAMCMPDGYDEKNDVNAAFPYFTDANWDIIPDDRIFNWRDLSPFKYPMCVWNKLYTKELFDKHHIDYAEGLDFEDHKVIFGTLLTAEKIFFIREKLYVYRYNREGSILTDNNTRLIDHMEIFNIVEKLMKETGTYDVLRTDFLTYKIHNILYYYGMIKDEYKREYYENMVECLRNTGLSDDEYNMFCEKYPELKEIDFK